MREGGFDKKTGTVDERCGCGATCEGGELGWVGLRLFLELWSSFLLRVENC